MAKILCQKQAYFFISDGVLQ